MKKLVMIVTLIIVFCGGTFAQTSFDVGAKVGLGLAKNNLAGVSMKPGLIGGVFFGIKPSPGLSIQPEILFAEKGMKIDFIFMEFKWKLTYLEIPILVKKSLSTGGNFRPVLFGGPFFSFLMSAKQVIESPLVGYSDEVDIKDGFKSTDMGIVVGGGADMKVGTSGLLVFDFRVSLSLTDNIEDRDKLGDVEVGEGSLKNLNISFMVGYAFASGQSGP